MVQKDRSDLNHKFPAFENFSRVLPGEERIHENVLVESTVLRDAQILGSALLHFGIKPGQETRVGIAGIHSVRYMTALHALVSYGMVLVPLYHNSKIEVLW
ncbi:unnamed protein product [Heligmosomoides polygyrus]|uniref:AMP-binding domain-containing protein n=1 Tax=Heligmosomoides polygyrus TaxID=6339 RepID=A0A183G1R8_HELPZ|nr:unnamed protein product [Heligmosomoides polygyrus]